MGDKKWVGKGGMRCYCCRPARKHLSRVRRHGRRVRKHEDRRGALSLD
jgi:hypothetical protein